MDVLLGVLLENAARHAPEGSTATIATTPGSRTLRIRNDAPDLTPSDLPSLTEPFWRKDAARTEASGGGLGLALAPEIARALAADLRFTLEGGSLVASLSWDSPVES